MALVRITERKITANRAKSRRSTGPRTPAGKRRSSRNGCVHHSYARTHAMPESWNANLHHEARRFTVQTADPIRRKRECRLAYLVLWHDRLLEQEQQLLAACLSRHPQESARAVHLFSFDPAIRAFRRHSIRIDTRVRRAIRALHVYLNTPVPRRPLTAPRPSVRPAGFENLLACLQDLRRTNPQLQQNTGPAQLPAAHPASVGGSQLTASLLPPSVQLPSSLTALRRTNPQLQQNTGSAQSHEAQPASVSGRQLTTSCRSLSFQRS
ncbi:MAG TPA: hypothetical protein VGK29_06030 [Paludibaculum sp.]|jgi:hypothetical protein